MPGEICGQDDDKDRRHKEDQIDSTFEHDRENARDAVEEPFKIRREEAKESFPPTANRDLMGNDEFCNRVHPTLPSKTIFFQRNKKAARRHGPPSQFRRQQALAAELGLYGRCRVTAVEGGDALEPRLYGIGLGLE